MDAFSILWVQFQQISNLIIPSPDISLNQTYPSGGAGYVFSRQTLKKFVEIGLEGNAICESNEIYEDLEVGSCMRKLNVTPGDSRSIFQYFYASSKNEKFHFLKV